VLIDLHLITLDGLVALNYYSVLISLNDQLVVMYGILELRLFSQVQVHLKYASMACHFLGEHLGGQMLHLWCQSQRMILKL